MWINNKVISKQKNSSSRVSAWLVVHKIAELELPTPFQNSATMFYNRASVFPPDSLQN